MADGKLNIKGTITIKTSKSKKKKRKPRKKKTGLADTGGYTGTGKAETREEFASPYTAQALMTAMALRPPPPQITYMQQPALEQPKYFSIEEYSTAPEGSMIGIKKEDVKVKIAPMLEYAQQQGLEEGRQRLEEMNRRTKEAEQQLEDQTLAMRQELEQRQQNFENELEQSTDYYNSELARMALTLSRGKAQSQLSLIGEKAKARQEMGKQALRNRVVVIRGMLEPALRQAISRIDPGYTFIAEEGKTKVDVLRNKLIELEGLSDIASEVEERVPLKRGPRPKTTQVSLASAEEPIQQQEQTEVGQRLLERARRRSESRASLSMSREEQINPQFMEQFTREGGTNF